MDAQAVKLHVCHGMASRILAMVTVKDNNRELSTLGMVQDG